MEALLTGMRESVRANLAVKGGKQQAAAKQSATVRIQAFIRGRLVRGHADRDRAAGATATGHTDAMPEPKTVTSVTEGAQASRPKATQPPVAPTARITAVQQKYKKGAQESRPKAMQPPVAPNARLTAVQQKYYDKRPDGWKRGMVMGDYRACDLCKASMPDDSICAKRNIQSGFDELCLQCAAVLPITLIGD